MHEINYHTDIINFFLGGGGAYWGGVLISKILLLEGRSLERGAYQSGRLLDHLR